MLLYGSEMWGAPTIKKDKSVGALLQELIKLESESLQLKFWRHISGVQNKTTLDAIYGDTGRFPLSLNVITNMLKIYWSRLCKQKENSIFKNCMMENIKMAKRGKFFWMRNVDYILECTGCNVDHILECTGMQNFKDPNNIEKNEIPISEVI